MQCWETNNSDLEEAVIAADAVKVNMRVSNIFDAIIAVIAS